MHNRGYRINTLFISIALFAHYCAYIFIGDALDDFYNTAYGNIRIITEFKNIECIGFECPIEMLNHSSTITIKNRHEVHIFNCVPDISQGIILSVVGMIIFSWTSLLVYSNKIVDNVLHILIYILDALIILNILISSMANSCPLANIIENNIIITALCIYVNSISNVIYNILSVSYTYCTILILIIFNIVEGMDIYSQFINIMHNNYVIGYDITYPSTHNITGFLMNDIKNMQMVNITCNNTCELNDHMKYWSMIPFLVTLSVLLLVELVHIISSINICAQIRYVVDKIYFIIMFNSIMVYFGYELYDILSNFNIHAYIMFIVGSINFIMLIGLQIVNFIFF